VLITISEPLGDLYKKRYPQLKKVEIIRNLLKYENPKNPEKFDNSKYSKTIIFHGHFKPGRGLEYLIKAMVKLSNIRLILVGGGELHTTLLNLVDKLSLNNVEFVDYINHDQLISHAARADVGAVLFEATSLNYSFALPNKFFEYIMAGLPVLASNIETLKFYVDKLNIGRTVDPTNEEEIVKTIKEMIKNDSNLEMWKNNCLELAKELNWENESKKLKSIYDAINK